MRLRRALSALVLAGLAVTGLAACQTKVGLAASVGSAKLTDSQLADYVQPGYSPSGTGGVTSNNRLTALETWLQTQLFTAAINAKGGPLTPAERSEVQQYLSRQGATESSDQTAVAKQGYSPKFGTLVFEQQTVLIALVKRLVPSLSVEQAASVLDPNSSQSQAASQAIISAADKSGASVHVSSRYGAWNGQSLSLSTDPTAGLPSFVSGAGASSSPAPGA